MNVESPQSTPVKGQVRGGGPVRSFFSCFSLVLGHVPMVIGVRWGFCGYLETVETRFVSVRAR